MFKYLLCFLLITIPAWAGSISVTQGETAVFSFTAQNGAGVAHDLSGASFVSYINGPKGKVNSFANSKHAIVSAAAGTFTLTLTAADTQLLLVGTDREIVTKVTQGSNVTVFRGTNLLNVLSILPVR